MDKHNIPSSQHRGNGASNRRARPAGPSLKELVAGASPALKEMVSSTYALYRLMPSYVGQKAPGASMRCAVLEECIDEQVHKLLSALADLHKSLITTTDSRS